MTDENLIKWVSNRSPRERYEAEQSVGHFIDTTEYWNLPDYRYEDLHREQEPMPEFDLQDLKHLPYPALVPSHPASPYYGTTRAERILDEASWEKTDRTKTKYHFNPEGGYDNIPNFPKTKGLKVSCELIPADKDKSPYFIFHAETPDGQKFQFPVYPNALVGMMQLLREHDCERPIIAVPDFEWDDMHE